VLGDAAVGKTSLLNRYIMNSFSEKYEATIAVDFKATTIEQPNYNV